MKKKAAGVLILVLSTLSLSSCLYFRPTGPCFGVGCPSHTVGQNGQYKAGEAPKTQNANDQPANQPTANAQVATAQDATAPAANAQVANSGTATQQSKQGRIAAFLQQSKAQLKSLF